MIRKQQNYYSNLNRYGIELAEDNRDNQIDNDYIEDEPLTIDLKILGIDLITEVPLDIVGVYSFASQGLCKKEGANFGIMEPINLVVNVNTRGKQKTISFES